MIVCSIVTEIMTGWFIHLLSLGIIISYSHWIGCLVAHTL